MKTSTGDQNPGTLWGVGVGPGAPDLLTLRAVNKIASADLVAYVQNAQGFSLSRHIARQVFENSSRNPDQQELSITLNMSKDRQLINSRYDQAAKEMAEFLATGKVVVFLCEGDPLFFGSFIYLQDRLQEHYPCQVVPGISSLNCASAESGVPLTLLDENLAVVSSRSSDQDILNALEKFHSVAILKAGPALSRLLQLLEQAGRFEESIYLERLSHDDQKIVTDLSLLVGNTGPYFSLLLTTRKERPLR